MYRLNEIVTLSLHEDILAYFYKASYLYNVHTVRNYAFHAIFVSKSFVKILALSMKDKTLISYFSGYYLANPLETNLYILYLNLITILFCSVMATTLAWQLYAGFFFYKVYSYV